MTDVPIQGLSDAAVARIDADTAAPLTIADLRRAATAVQDLDNDQVMSAAWR